MWGKRALLVVVFGLSLVAGGCSITRVTCDGGYCGVGYTRPADAPTRPAKRVEDVKLLRGREPIPPGARAVGTFTWSVTLLDAVVSGDFSKCPDEIEGFFRGKAANLGYDGVAGVAYASSGGGGGGGEARMVILDTNGGLYRSPDSASSSGTNTLTGGAPVFAAMNVPPYGTCVGVPYVIEPR
ncbi:MAG: hypothetical protein KF819_40675 [Labilithrix sp.]|nr:hypothetical protein [Labilithrix sp.]